MLLDLEGTKPYPVTSEVSPSSGSSGSRARHVLMGHSLGAACAAAEVITHPEVGGTILYPFELQDSQNVSYILRLTYHTRVRPHSYRIVWIA